MDLKFFKNKVFASVRAGIMGKRRGFSRQSAGFTLLEVVVAMAVVATGVIAGLTLTTFNINTAAISERRLVAANLVREALEVVRQKRDSNWLAADDWTTGITDLGGVRFTTDFDAENNSWAFTPRAEALTLCGDCVIGLNKDTGVFTSEAGYPATAFRRQVYFNEICWQDAVGDEVILDEGQPCSGLGLELAGLELHSTVAWAENGEEQTLEAVDRIYNWR